MNSKRAVVQILRHWATTGVRHIPRVVIPKSPPAASTSRASDREASARARQNQAAAAVTERTAGRPVHRNLFTKSDIDGDSIARPEVHSGTRRLLDQQFEGIESKRSALCELADVVTGCTRCSQLASTRKQTVFGVGNPDARIMFIGEAPGADEDRQGEPFVGKAGQLLNRIITACQLTREEIYICNILRCRPPGNRTPLPQEAANCREFLDGQIHIVQPEYIVCWGSVAAQNLLGEKRPISRMRGQFMSHENAKVLCTYHPSYLLRYPAAKTQVWEDMKFLMKDMGVDL